MKRLFKTTSTEEKTDESSNKPSIQNRYHFKTTLGKGASCRVVAATSRTNRSKKVAIKIMSKERKSSAQLFELECGLLKALSEDGKSEHRNVLKFVGSEEDEYNYYILTSLLEGGELFDRIVSKDDKYIITEKRAAELVRSMCEAVQYCHQHNVAHRDLKPENFVFESPDPDADLVLIDFGCGSLLDANDSKKTYDNLVGTAYYVAPEVAYLALSKSSDSKIAEQYAPMVKPRTGDVLKASDVWSIGVIAYVMLTGRAPFRGRSNTEIFESIVSDKVTYPENDARYKTPLKLNPAFKDFLEKVLVKDPAQRLSIEDCIRHPWVQGIEAKDWVLNTDVIRFLRQFNYQAKLKKEITRILAANMSSEPAEQVRRHFVRLDADGDGFLDEQELSYLLLDMGYAKSAALPEAREIIKHADRNDDNVIDFEEFKAAWYRKILSTNDQFINRVFNVFDANGDGQIDVNELKNVLMPEPNTNSDDTKEQEKEKDKEQDKEKDKEQDKEKDKDKTNDTDNSEDNNQLKHLAQMIDEVDLNGDHMISFQEFQACMKEDIEKGHFNVQSFQVGGNVGDSK
ncbi:calcium-dependent protein kinase [Reticulomyxa filosa]|uniref:Calcium-dependent protein kinase n=1 Tax=Reticulomyxa filosa TaxID=46433 RepID=X6MTB8_RETFI|nr:calcium-dependent protein kinase [Reticulomyxa filosa]|eukprot:ETO16350.1 calcium-dependent protein kinase [Reticulomyxa filosa]